MAEAVEVVADSTLEAWTTTLAVVEDLASPLLDVLLLPPSLPMVLLPGSPPESSVTMLLPKTYPILTATTGRCSNLMLSQSRAALALAPKATHLAKPTALRGELLQLAKTLPVR